MSYHQARGIIRPVLSISFERINTARKKRTPNLCNNVNAVAFVKRFRADCESIARQLNVPVENVLGLAAQESQYGNGRIARELNNYFSMHAPASYEIGEQPALGNNKVKVAKFASFADCGRSFVARFGNTLRGRKDPKDFARGLVLAGFNTGDAANGGRPGFDLYVVSIIESVKARMLCD